MLVVVVVAFFSLSSASSSRTAHRIGCVGRYFRRLFKPSSTNLLFFYRIFSKFISIFVGNDSKDFFLSNDMKFAGSRSW